MLHFWVCDVRNDEFVKHECRVESATLLCATALLPLVRSAPASCAASQFAGALVQLEALLVAVEVQVARLVGEAQAATKTVYAHVDIWGKKSHLLLVPLSCSYSGF